MGSLSLTPPLPPRSNSWPINRNQLKVSISFALEIRDGLVLRSYDQSSQKSIMQSSNLLSSAKINYRNVQLMILPIFDQSVI